MRSRFRRSSRPLWANLGFVPSFRVGARCGALGLASLVAVATGNTAQADQLSIEQHDDERGYVAIEELSYETIIDASDGYSATLRLRTALHNTSATARDAVLSLALPAASELRAIRASKDGTWTAGRVTVAHPGADRRDPGTVFARQLAPSRHGRLPGAEVVAFGVGADETIQIELELTVYPRLQGDNWLLDLPARGVRNVALSAERRVLVKGLRKDEPFSVDEVGNRGKPYVVTSSQDGVTVAWPAHLASSEEIEGQFELMPGPPGFDDGEFRAYVRLGVTAAPRPDHLVLVVDQSRSAPASLQRETKRLAKSMLDALSPGATFDAVGYSREASGLIGDGKPPRADDAEARKSLMTALDRSERFQGSDLEAALAEAAARAKRRGSKRPMIVVVTDGMLPFTLEPKAVAGSFRSTWGKRRKAPEVLFVVDDPLLLQSGLTPTHPITQVAAALGARVSLETLANLGTDRTTELLASPRVMGDLELDLPDHFKLRDKVPAGLVAGTVVVLRGSYVGDPVDKLKVRGRFGTSKIERELTAKIKPRLPNALTAAAAGDLDVAAKEGFVRPPWYELDQQRTARQSIEQAGRGGFQKKGHLDRKIFRHYLTTRVLPRARVCYNHGLTREPTQAGRVQLDFEIGKGEVMLAGIGKSELAFEDKKLVECLTEAAWALDVPAGKMDDKVYVLHYPLSLVPPEGGEPAQVEGISDEMMELLLGTPGQSDTLAQDE